METHAATGPNSFSRSMAGQGLKEAIEANSFRVMPRNTVLRPEAATRTLILRAKKDETGSGGDKKLVESGKEAR